MVVEGFEPGIHGLQNSRLTIELPKSTTTKYYKICIYIQYGVSDHTTFDLCNPTIPIERSLGEPMCLCKYAIRNKTGNQKKNCTE